VFDALACFKGSPGRVVLPDVACDVRFIDGRPFLSGPVTHARELEGTGGVHTILRIAPAAAMRLLGVAVWEITDRVIPLDEVHPGLARDCAAAFEAGHLQELVVPTTAEVVDARFTVGMAILGAGGSVREAAAAACLSERQLERVFDENAGVRPKLYARITRLRRALLAAGQGSSFASAALAHGYADQAHFNREVRAFTGQAPAALLPNVGSVQDVVAGRL
jgi:AraC-like DNA-binding protein